MKLAYWGFRHWPFDRSFATDRFFASQQHEEAMARLLFLVEENRRFGLLLGPGGIGKSYLMSLLQRRVERLGRLVVQCDASGMDGNEFLLQIALSCQAGVDVQSTRSQVWHGLRARFAALALVRQPLVLLIDHFDHVEFSCQQAVWRLHQLADSVGLTLTIVLATRERSVSSLLQDLVELRSEVSPWLMTETAQYVTDAVQHAGVQHRLFDDAALKAIHLATHGIPSSILNLCSHCLLAAQASDQAVVTQECVEAVIAELMPDMAGRGPKHRLPLDPFGPGNRTSAMVPKERTLVENR